jgi:formylglycine-generating enzyme required for sulfatase activity
MKKFHLLLLFPLLGMMAMRSDRKIDRGARYVLDQMKYIPATTFVFHPDGVAKDPVNITTRGFYLSDIEVSNGMYLTYLNELQATDAAAYLKALPDTNAWMSNMMYAEPYRDYYLRHPAYRDYPVVGVTHSQAKAYCSWLTRKVLELKDPEYANSHFDLPSENEWICAASGGKEFNYFPWDGNSMMSREGKWLANFQPVDQSTARRDDDTTRNHTYTVYGGQYFMDGAFITTSVHSYHANLNGLYNMAGNVEEMVNEEGVSKGGSWSDTGYYLRIGVSESYAPGSVSVERGFRVAMYIDAGK